MKIIIINPAGGEVSKLYQYDKGCKIRLFLKNAKKVIINYSCTGMSEAAVVNATAVKDDTFEAEVPNVVLEYGNNITLYIGYISDDNSQIVDSATISVEKRTKPADFITENPSTVLNANTLNASKLDNHFDAAEAGKALMISDTGDVVPRTIQSIYDYMVEAGYQGTEAAMKNKLITLLS